MQVLAQSQVLIDFNRIRIRMNDSLLQTIIFLPNFISHLYFEFHKLSTIIKLPTGLMVLKNIYVLENKLFEEVFWESYESILNTEMKLHIVFNKAILPGELKY